MTSWKLPRLTEVRGRTWNLLAGSKKPTPPVKGHELLLVRPLHRQREKWTLNELISFCVQEEERLKQEKTESAHLASTSKDKGKKRKNEAAKDKGPAHKKQTQTNSDDGCFFCNMKGHMKKECAKYIAWRAKKGLPELPKAK
ncbi:uncharacterized protein LOC115698136 [Cannabis sativa]|uniref:uncharacterized protein LOC115698136 n=1 Tax=Cannabis sativa TaxID=3483 RepID=UPI0029CA4006|nr:uncharacterized protein LOC115698136 [Cannabis sativa]